MLSWAGHSDHPSTSIAMYERILNNWLNELRYHAAICGQTFRVSEASGRWRIVEYNDNINEPFDDVLFSTDLIVYPTGLVLPLREVSWFWDIEGKLYIGNAVQASLFARGPVYTVDKETAYDNWVVIRSFPHWVNSKLGYFRC